MACLLSAVPKGAQTSQEFNYSSSAELHDVQSEVTYEVCDGACPHIDGWAPGCHVDCSRLVGERIQECLQVVAYTFEPRSPRQRSRKLWLRNHLLASWEKVTSDVPREVHNLRGIPIELRQQIAGQLLCEYSTAKLNALQLPNADYIQKFSVHQRIWAHFVRFEGTAYIASLSNIPNDKHQLIYDHHIQQAVDTIYVREDHLGIIEVIFASSREILAICEHPDVWWRLIRLPRISYILEGQTDVSFITFTAYSIN